MAKKICDFCLEEEKGLFRQPQELLGGYYICRKCRKKIEDHGLPVKYDLFQLLVTAEPSMRSSIMREWLENKNPDDVIARYYAAPSILLHEGEHCITAVNTSIRVPSSAIPQDKAPAAIVDITGKNINNIPDAAQEEESQIVNGVLYETDNALYFLSEHFINCHRLANIIRSPLDPDHIRVLDNSGKKYTYPVKNTDLFFLREQFYTMTAEKKKNKDSSLIYLESDNTMTLTPGLYDVPRNIMPGTYWISPDDNKNIRVMDANGKNCPVRKGKVHIYAGSTIRLAKEYKFRLTPKEEK